MVLKYEKYSTFKAVLMLLVFIGFIFGMISFDELLQQLSIAIFSLVLIIII